MQVLSACGVRERELMLYLMVPLDEALRWSLCSRSREAAGQRVAAVWGGRAGAAGLGLGLGLEEVFVFDSKSENRLGLGLGLDMFFEPLMTTSGLGLRLEVVFVLGLGLGLDAGLHGSWGLRDSERMRVWET